MTSHDKSEAPLFLDAAGLRAFEAAVGDAARLVATVSRARRGPTSGANHAELDRALASLDICPEEGVGLDRVLAEVGELVLPAGVGVGHPHYAAHLHSVPAIPALAAEVLISATNQSLDSFDQSASATTLERRMVAYLTRIFGLGDRGDGVFTGGATASNLLGLMLARDLYAKKRLGHDVGQQGLPPDAGRFCILCSEHAHFSVDRAAALLGLGQCAVVRVAADDQGVVRPPTLRAAIDRELGADRLPIAVVLTAGTTDLGSIDALEENIELTTRRAVRTHVDAAAGGAYIFSESLRPLLKGIELADSIAVDFHKLLFQPISCAAFLVREAEDLALLRRRIVYLDPNDRERQAGPNLVGKSLDTTRRFDALKAFMTLRAVGRRRLGRLLEASVATARHAAAAVEEHPHLELLARPMTNTALLRWSPGQRSIASDLVDAVNRGLPHRLWQRGGPVLGGTAYRGKPCLKLTLISPICTNADVESMLDEVAQQAERALDGLRRARRALRRGRESLEVTRVRSTDAAFAIALKHEFRIFGIANRYASEQDVAAGRMLAYCRYDAHSEFFLASDKKAGVAGIVRLIRCDAAAGLDSFSTLVDARSYSTRGERPRSYLDPMWERRFDRIRPQSIAELATQAMAVPYRRFRAVDPLWHAICGACRAEGVELWTMALIVPLFKFYKALLPGALEAIGKVMPDYIGADSVPAVLRLEHPEVQRYLRHSSKEVADDCYV